MFFQDTLFIDTPKRGLHLITRSIVSVLPLDKIQVGILHLFLPHTSASLLLQENASPSAKSDLEVFLNKLAPDGESWHRHTDEGEDDSSAHMKAAVTQTSLSIPVSQGQLRLGTWQGIYLWEHRTSPHARQLVVTLHGD